ncbi:unnamed protein product [Peniophora sp. CBMAI 1063]|nr:unnamed protein product [Peniophora sp. CBMAI 1063]
MSASGMSGVPVEDSLPDDTTGHFLTDFTMDAGANITEVDMGTQEDIMYSTGWGGPTIDQIWQDIQLFAEFASGPSPSGEEAASILAERILVGQTTVRPKDVLQLMPPWRMGDRLWLVQVPDGSTRVTRLPKDCPEAGDWTIPLGDGTLFEFRTHHIPPPPVTTTSTAPSPTDASDASSPTEASSPEGVGAPSTPPPSLGDSAEDSATAPTPLPGGPDMPADAINPSAPVEASNDVDMVDMDGSPSASESTPSPVGNARVRRPNKKNSKSTRSAPYSKEKPQVVASSDDLSAHNIQSTNATPTGSAHVGDAGGETSSRVRAPPPTKGRMGATLPDPTNAMYSTLDQIIDSATGTSGRKVKFIAACWEDKVLRAFLTKTEVEALRAMTGGKSKDGGRWRCIFPGRDGPCVKTYKYPNTRDRHVNEDHLHDELGLPLPNITGGAICPHCNGYMYRGDKDFTEKRHINDCKARTEAKKKQDEAAKRLADSVSSE